MTDSLASRGLAGWRATRQAKQARIDAAAEAQLAADEQRLDGPRKRRLSLADVAGRFWSHPSPFVLAVMVAVTVTARFVAGGFGTGDLVVAAVMMVTFPVTEWLIHVFILHLKPIRMGRVTIDPLLAQEHRAHHADPRDIPLVFIPWQTYLWLLPILAVVGLLVFPDLGLGLTYLAVLSVQGFVYEWTHYLIHSDYKPRTVAYRAVWRNHRLHHYKNENYWFTVTSSGTADRLFRTYPDPADVPTSPTAKDLAAR